MKNILSSASRIVFILLALVACIAFLIGRLEAKDFMLLASMAFAFYFSKRDGDGGGGGEVGMVPSPR